MFSRLLCFANPRGNTDSRVQHSQGCFAPQGKAAMILRVEISLETLEVLFKRGGVAVIIVVTFSLERRT